MCTLVQSGIISHMLSVDSSKRGFSLIPFTQYFLYCCNLVSMQIPNPYCKLFCFPYCQLKGPEQMLLAALTMQWTLPLFVFDRLSYWSDPLFMFIFVCSNPFSFNLIERGWDLMTKANIGSWSCNTNLLVIGVLIFLIQTHFYERNKNSTCRMMECVFISTVWNSTVI